MNATVMEPDTRPRVALVMNEVGYASRPRTRAAMEALSIVVAIERDAKSFCNVSSLDGIDAIVLVKDGLLAGPRASVMTKARVAGVRVIQVSAKTSDWSELRKLASEPAIVVEDVVPPFMPVPRLPLRACISPPAVDLPPLPEPAPTVTELEDLAKSYAADADRFKQDLYVSMEKVAELETIILRMARDAENAPAVREANERRAEADRKRNAAEAVARKAEADLVDQRNEISRLRVELEVRLEELETQAEEFQARLRQAADAATAPSNTDKILGALKVLVESCGMSPEEAWNRLVGAKP